MESKYKGKFDIEISNDKVNINSPLLKDELELSINEGKFVGANIVYVENIDGMMYEFSVNGDFCSDYKIENTQLAEDCTYVQVIVVDGKKRSTFYTDITNLIKTEE